MIKMNLQTYPKVVVRESTIVRFLGSEGSLNWSREIWILVKRLLGAASRKYSGSQMIPLVSSRRQRQSNLPSDVDKRASRDGQFDHESFIRG